MKPELLVFKRRRTLGKKSVPDTYFAVFDTEKQTSYFENFVGMLPQDPKAYFGRANYMPEFVKLFREESLHVAIQLLEGVLAKEHDKDAAQEIQKLLRKLTIERNVRVSEGRNSARIETVSVQ